MATIMPTNVVFGKPEEEGVISFGLFREVIAIICCGGKLSKLVA